MKKCLKLFAALIIVTAPCSSLYNSQAASAQPEQIKEETTGISGSSSTAASGSGVAYPQTSRPGRVAPVKDQLNIGTPSAAEVGAISRVKLPSNFNPRKSIAFSVKNLSSLAGPPMLSRAHLQFLENKSLAQAIPDSIFYSLKFPQWPVAFNVPEPLSSNNIFAFDASAKPVLITTEEAMKKHFREHITPVKSDREARAALAAYLTLAEMLAQDGMYQFSIAEDDMKVLNENAGTTVSGASTVRPVGGNSGAITAKLHFSAKGNLISAQHSVNLQAGMRPICQSTKLLDPDILVRRMAEQDLLIMGSAAKPYLDEQRSKLSPALQKEIDRVWARIVAEGR